MESNYNIGNETNPKNEDQGSRRNQLEFSAKFLIAGVIGLMVLALYLIIF